MIRRLAGVLYLLSLSAAWFLAAQTWAGARIADSQEPIAITAVDAYPQLTLIFVTWSLIFWLAKYLNSIFSKFLVSTVVILLFATASPVWFESAAGSMSILSPQVTKKTGISDWIGQATLIKDSYYSHVVADLFVIALILCFISALVYIWASKPGAKAKQFTTRIDKLPSW